MVERALAAEHATAAPDALAHLVDLAGGDARAALTTLEVALALAAADGGRAEVDARRRRAGPPVTRAALRRGRALRRHLRLHQVDPGARTPTPGLYWLARMLEAGEDARYIARRLVILASEDVGMADSMGLVVADAAARAVEFVGLPEAGLNLAHAVIYLATAPKSNTAMAGLVRGPRATCAAARPVPSPARCAACTPTSATS